MPGIPLALNRLLLEVGGLAVGEVSLDIISVRYAESLTRDGSLEVSLNNWGGSPPDYKYSEENALHIGAQVKLFCGDVALATGTITSLMPHFYSGGQPRLAFTAQMKRPTVRESSPPLVLGYGTLLREFHSLRRSTGNLRRQSITATGVTDGLPSLRAGVRVDIDGVGARWSGIYSVTDTTHCFDDQSGYHVEFACSR